MTEQLLAYHCGPALAGIKPANLVSIRYSDGIISELHCLNHKMNHTGICIEILSQQKDRILVLVYRKRKLEQYLYSEEISNFLAGCGYPTKNELDPYLSFLRKRLSSSIGFPHEIGAFLGYPLHDIFGFLNRSKAVYTGYWKVYQNADEAKKLFERYDKCRSAILRRVNSGKSIAEIFGEA